MSGFDVNVLSTKPVIREAASMQNDGGAGNLGYMQQGESEQEEKKRHFDESIFSKKEKDIFIMVEIRYIINCVENLRMKKIKWIKIKNEE